MAQCVSGTMVPVGGQSAHILSDTTTSIQKVQSELGFDATLKASYGIVDVSDSASFAQSITNDDYSVSFIFTADYVTGGDYLKTDKVSDTDVGSAAHKTGWSRSCGDQFVQQIAYGGRFYFLERIDFETKEEKTQFNDDLHVSVSEGVASVDVKAKLKMAGASFASSAHVHLEALQIGGDVTKLGSVFNGAVTVAGAKASEECDMAHLDACEAFRTSAMQYTDPSNPVGFAAQLADPHGVKNPVSYGLSSWETIGRAMMPDILGSEVVTARADLKNKFVGMMKIKVRADRLISEADDFKVTPVQRSKLDELETAISSNMTFINKAVIACYDDIRFDAGGRSLAASLDACRKAVDAVPSLDVVKNILSSGGQFAISEKWQSLGGNDSFVGSCTTPAGDPACESGSRSTGKTMGGLVQSFSTGEILWSPNTDAHEVDGPILDLYRRLGDAGPRAVSALGFPTSDVHRMSGGQYSDFESGQIYWSKDTGAHIVEGIVEGDIGKKYADFNSAEGKMGYPITDELLCKDNYGRYNIFKNGAAIYWTKEHGAHSVWGNIYIEWKRNGAEAGAFGYPTTDEIVDADKRHTHSEFERGAIYFSLDLGYTYNLLGPVWAKYQEKGGGKDSFLGYPSGPILPLPGGSGTYNQFEKGAIYFVPGVGTHALGNEIMGEYARLGYQAETLWWTHATLGFPTSDQEPAGDGVFAQFQNGAIYWSPATGAHVISGLFLDEWNRRGGIHSKCGFPLGVYNTTRSCGPFCHKAAITQSFQHGSMVTDLSGGDFNDNCH